MWKLFASKRMVNENKTSKFVRLLEMNLMFPCLHFIEIKLNLNADCWLVGKHYSLNMQSEICFSAICLKLIYEYKTYLGSAIQFYPESQILGVYRLTLHDKTSMS